MLSVTKIEKIKTKKGPTAVLCLLSLPLPLRPTSPATQARCVLDNAWRAEVYVAMYDHLQLAQPKPPVISTLSRRPSTSPH